MQLLSPIILDVCVFVKSQMTFSNVMKFTVNEKWKWEEICKLYKKDEKETRHYQVMRKCKKVEFARGQIAVHHYREERRRWKRSFYVKWEWQLSYINT